MKNKFLILLSFIGLLVGCAPSTQLKSVWTDPSVKPGSIKFKKILVIASLRDETGSRTAEDRIVSQIRTGEAIQSYMYLSSSDTNNAAVNARLLKSGFDGLLIMRLANVDESLNVQQGYYSGGYGGYYGGYYGGHYGGYYNPGSVSVDKNFIVETKIYSLDPGKLLWSGMTSTLNPTSLTASLDEVIAAIKAQLIKQGLINPESGQGAK